MSSHTTAEKHPDHTLVNHLQSSAIPVLCPCAGTTNPCKKQAVPKYEAVPGQSPRPQN